MSGSDDLRADIVALGRVVTQMNDYQHALSLLQNTQSRLLQAIVKHLSGDRQNIQAIQPLVNELAERTDELIAMCEIHMAELDQPIEEHGTKQ